MLCVMLSAAILGAATVAAEEPSTAESPAPEARGPHLLEIAFTVPLAGDASGAHRLAFGVARSPLTRMNLMLEQAPARIQASGGVVEATAANGGRAEVHLLWPPTDQVSLAWL